MSLKRLIHGSLVAATLCVASCGSSAAPPVVPSGAPEAAPSASPTAPTQDAQSPLDARLESPAGVPEPSRIVLAWTVEQRVALGIPVHVSVAVPAECRLVAGRAVADLQAVVGQARETLEVACRSLPTTDLLITVDARASDFGYHEDLVYRFGRVAPQLMNPTLGPMRVHVGGHDYGRPVMAQPAQPAH